MHDLYKLTNHKGMGKKLKGALPDSLFRVLRSIYNRSMTMLPYSVKYGLTTSMRKNKYPYKVIEEGDLVVQVGAPKDILYAGRSRALHFIRMVGVRGKVMVVEPESINCDALEEYTKKNDLFDRVKLAKVGAWSSVGELKFLYNPDHPASNILVDVHSNKIERDNIDLQDFDTVKVPVSTIDILLMEETRELDPKLISITANGAELEILKGMKDVLSRGVPYISLAATGAGYVEAMSELNYELVALDDRGYTFKSVNI